MHKAVGWKEKPWTVEEERRLFRPDRTERELAEELGRTMASISGKKMKLQKLSRAPENRIPQPFRRKGHPEEFYIFFRTTESSPDGEYVMTKKEDITHIIDTAAFPSVAFYDAYRVYMKAKRINEK